MEEKENYACELELKGGYHGRPYPQKFVRAKSEHPYPCNYQAEKVPSNVMRVTHGHK